MMEKTALVYNDIITGASLMINNMFEIIKYNPKYENELMDLIRQEGEEDTLFIYQRN